MKSSCVKTYSNCSVNYEANYRKLKQNESFLGKNKISKTQIHSCFQNRFDIHGYECFEGFEPTCPGEADVSAFDIYQHFSFSVVNIHFSARMVYIVTVMVYLIH